MLSVSVMWHKDGDRLAIFEKPWWSPVYERLVNAFFCPCHGLSGLLSRMEWYGVLTYRIWSGLLTISYRQEKERFAVPIESGCVAAEALWGDHGCWHDDCTVRRAEA